MDGSTLQRVKEALLSRRQEISRSGNGSAGAAPAASAEASAELIDIAQAMEQLDREKSLAEQERRELLAIERALAKMATGAFGICEECDEEIPSKRLLVLPEARLCARCQAVEEYQVSRTRGGGTPGAVAR